MGNGHLDPYTIPYVSFKSVKCSHKIKNEKKIRWSTVERRDPEFKSVSVHPSIPAETIEDSYASENTNTSGRKIWFLYTLRIGLGHINGIKDL